MLTDDQFKEKNCGYYVQKKKRERNVLLLEIGRELDTENLKQYNKRVSKLSLSFALGRFE